LQRKDPKLLLSERFGDLYGRLEICSVSGRLLDNLGELVLSIRTRKSICINKGVGIKEVNFRGKNVLLGAKKTVYDNEVFTSIL